MSANGAAGRTLKVAAKLWAWACAAAARSPVTWLGLLALPPLILLLYVYGLGQHDMVLLAVTVCGLALFGVAAVSVGLTALCLWLRLRPRELPPLEIEAGVPVRTGFVLRGLGWLPLVKVEWTWEQPAGVRLRPVSVGGTLVEEVTADERGRWETVTRRFVVGDVFGLTRFMFRRRATQTVTVLPAAGEVRALELLPQHDRGDLTAHPEGKPDGDLIEMRPYAPGDPLKRILWKVYARTGRLLVRNPERAIKPCERSLLYFVAGAGDEPSAGVARSLLEAGALGRDFIFGADGTEGTTDERAEALDRVVRSAGVRGQGGAGLGAFLAAGEAEGVRACILFVPHRPGVWLDRVAGEVVARPGPVRALVGVDGLRPERQGWSLRRLLLVSHRPGAAAHPEDVRSVCTRLSQAGAEVLVIDRVTGALIDWSSQMLSNPTAMIPQAQGA